MISVEGLTKYYGPRPAILDVTFQVQKGEVLGLLGPNGAGKTTTMRILTGFMPASAGKTRVAGYDVFSQSVEARRQIGYVPETVPLYPEMSVRGYLEFIAKVKGINGKDRKPSMNRVMELVRVEDVRDRLIGKLSRGYRQRVGLAQALLGDPPILVLDEPTAGLDPKQIIETRNLIKDLGGDHTIILSTHILPEVSMTCNRVAIINGGRIVAQDTPENLAHRLRGSEDIAVQVRGPRDEVADRLREVPHIVLVSAVSDSSEVHTFTVASELGCDLREEIASAVVGSGWGLLELRPVGMSLEEIFLNLTMSEEILRE